MDNKSINVWSPIEFNDSWERADISKFEDLAPSWYIKRKEFEEGRENYDEFLVKLKRQHAIETGVVEKLYDLNEGITETLIKNGFVESYIGHNDTNIPPSQLMKYLNSHFEAMDFIFDLVKSKRSLSKSFIKELHQLITNHQEYTEGIDSLGNRVKISLLKGEFKKYDNNPKREDGTIFLYCPPIQVEGEVDQLIEIYNQLVEKKINPIIIAAWVHHSFTKIHPFQDGNGRIARLLSSLILIKNGLLPFTVKRNDKKKYIDALEKADKNEPQDLVSFFSIEQKKSIELALNFKTERKFSSFNELTQIFNNKIDKSIESAKLKRKKKLDRNREKVFDHIYGILGDIRREFHNAIPRNKADITMRCIKPNEEKSHYYTHQIIEYAIKYDYFFNRNLPKGWFGIYFKLPNNYNYNLILSIHHYGYDDNVLSLGAFLEYIESNNNDDGQKISLPINIEPFTISLENISDITSINLKDYINDVVKLGFSIIINEM